MLKNSDEVIEALKCAKLREHLHTNLEVKEDWQLRHGEKLSALANKLSHLVYFLVIGVTDEGRAAGHDEKWARKTEEVISQHINVNLDPTQSCALIECKEVAGVWTIVITVKNVGEVTYWDGIAFSASGTTLARMEPEEVLKLRLQLPGLFDFSNQHIKSQYAPELVADFASRVKEAGHPLEIEIKGSKENSVLLHLGIADRQAARVLFGRCRFRVVKYDAQGDVIENREEFGLFKLLRREFIGTLTSIQGCQYSSKAIKEALSNAVAHAAYFENDGEVVIEIYPTKIVLSNLCIRESLYFANRWFSRSHKTVNGLLMESLRVAKIVDELGRGKHIIFSESIKQGHRAPEVVIENAGKYKRWKLTIHGGNSDEKYLRLLRRTQEIYQEPRKALIAQALVLWRDKPVKEIRNFVDDEFATTFGEVLAGYDGPIVYLKDTDKIALSRWARVLLGEGKDSKALSPGEEEGLYNRLYDFCSRHEGGMVTPKLIRDFAIMGNTKSEQTLSSSILASWVEKQWVEKAGHGKYRFLHKRPPDQRDIVEVIRWFETLKDPAKMI